MNKRKEQIINVAGVDILRLNYACELYKVSKILARKAVRLGHLPIVKSLGINPFWVKEKDFTAWIVSSSTRDADGKVKKAI